MILGLVVAGLGIAYGIATDNVAEFWCGVFILGLLAIEPIEHFVKRELAIYRRVVRHEDLDQHGLDRVDRTAA